MSGTGSDNPPVRPQEGVELALAELASSADLVSWRRGPIANGEAAHCIDVSVQPDCSVLDEPFAQIFEVWCADPCPLDVQR